MRISRTNHLLACKLPMPLRRSDQTGAYKKDHVSHMRVGMTRARVRQIDNGISLDELFQNGVIGSDMLSDVT